LPKKRVKLFIIAYQHEGRTCECSIEAVNMADAERHLQSLNTSGELVAEVLADFDADQHLIYKLFNKEGPDDGYTKK